MTGDDSYGHAEKTRTPFREYSCFPGKEQDRQWQQPIDAKPLKPPMSGFLSGTKVGARTIGKRCVIRFNRSLCST